MSEGIHMRAAVSGQLNRVLGETETPWRPGAKGIIPGIPVHESRPPIAVPWHASCWAEGLRERNNPALIHQTDSIAYFCVVNEIGCTDLIEITPSSPVISYIFAHVLISP
ncbi:hypothetical protein [Cryobacterium sp. TMT1-66-1]|uniref:hypothetical protein n=1 Tax=Cryobacterium sp. TMT1-66-1 TaxID=1259242 RepID=UPI001F54169F|nr:hypothetical protein [Cryobacterium sp. TMT1-66-1]